MGQLYKGPRPLLNKSVSTGVDMQTDTLHSNWSAHKLEYINGYLVMYLGLIELQRKSR